MLCMNLYFIYIGSDIVTKCKRRKVCLNMKFQMNFFNQEELSSYVQLQRLLHQYLCHLSHKQMAEQLYIEEYTNIATGVIDIFHKSQQISHSQSERKNRHLQNKWKIHHVKYT